MNSQSAALLESIAQALMWGMNDPAGHTSWNASLCGTVGSAGWKLRAFEETRLAATVFDSSVVPPIAVNKYLMRLGSAFRCSDATFIAALIVVDRLLEYDGGRLPLTMRNVHRVYFASLVVAVKFHEDRVFSNRHYAKAGGVHLREVNRLERVVLAALDFKLRVEPEQYQRYEAALLTLSRVRSNAKDTAGTAADAQLEVHNTAAALAPMARATEAQQPVLTRCESREADKQATEAQQPVLSRCEAREADKQEDPARVAATAASEASGPSTAFQASEPSAASQVPSARAEGMTVVQG